MLRNIFARSRFLAIIAVIGSFIASIGMLVYGGLVMVFIMIDAFAHGGFNVTGAKHLAKDENKPA